MKVRIRVDIEVDVPVTAVVGGATPETIAKAARTVLPKSIGSIFSPWKSRVDVDVLTEPDPKAKE